MNRRRTLWTVAAALLTIVTACVTVSAGVGARSPQFRWLVPAQAPSNWKHAKLPSGAAVLYYPSNLQRIRSDVGAITAVQKNSHGLFPIYLNATPRQGNERLATWPAFRLRVNTEEGARGAHNDGAVTNVPFLGGTGSCVIDDYFSRVGAHHYKEIACYTEGPHGGSVVIAATFASLWAKERALLEQAIAAYRAT